MDEKRMGLRATAISDEELEGIVGGAQGSATTPCAGCGRRFLPGALYSAQGNRKLCSACYRKELSGERRG